MTENADQGEAARSYLEKAATLAKKPGTRENEKNTLALWKAQLGSVAWPRRTGWRNILRFMR